MPSPIYLDYNATAPLKPEVHQCMAEMLERPTNPSAVHAYGRKARKQLEDARRNIAQILNCFPQEIIFSASATEANNTVLNLFAGKPVWISAIEHSSVVKVVPAAELLPVDEQGVVKLDNLQNKLQNGRKPALISVMLANNETGVIQPVKEICAIAKQYNVPVHTDAVQALGKFPLDIAEIPADYITLTSHKCGGPLGAAVLVVKDGSPYKPFIQGGGQELNRRAGTENVAAIVGMAKAFELAQDLSHMQQLRGWLDAMEAEITKTAPNAMVMGKNASRLANTSCIAMPGVDQEVQLMRFDLSGLMVSAGSACSSGRIEPSHVLQAMGLGPETARQAIRVSTGWNTKEADIAAFTKAWKSVYAELAAGKAKNPELAA